MQACLIRQQKEITEQKSSTKEKKLCVRQRKQPEIEIIMDLGTTVMNSIFTFILLVSESFRKREK